MILVSVVTYVIQLHCRGKNIKNWNYIKLKIFHTWKNTKNLPHEKKSVYLTYFESPVVDT